RAAILVDDEGQGFAEEHAARLFEPFFTTRATGTGIGLAVVRRVVDASNGRIEVTRSPTGGGRLGIELPAATASSVPPSPSRE
ncbi:MAG TPA: ATP-binding protein, partial [Polyangiaceae bacterium]